MNRLHHAPPCPAHSVNPPVDRRQLVVGTALALATAAAPTRALAAVPPSAEARVEALLVAIGGREAWAGTRGYRVEARHYLAAEPRPVANTILLDFRAPRVRIESAPAAGWRARVLDGDRGWRLASEGARRLSPEEVADDRGFWTANVYRTLHRLALRAPELSVEFASVDRLIVSEQGRPLIWYRQNAAGEPIAFGLGADPDGTIFGPLAQHGPLLFPSFSVRDGGRWRAMIDLFTVDPDLSGDALHRGVPRRLLDAASGRRST